MRPPAQRGSYGKNIIPGTGKARLNGPFPHVWPVRMGVTASGLRPRTGRPPWPTSFRLKGWFLRQQATACQSVSGLSRSGHGSRGRIHESGGGPRGDPLSLSIQTIARCPQKGQTHRVGSPAGAWAAVASSAGGLGSGAAKPVARKTAWAWARRAWRPRLASSP